MIIHNDGVVQCRVRITGTYQGKPFTYEDPPDDQGSQFYHPDGDPSEFWWSEGNMACDCNRGAYVGIKDMPCGDTICIDVIAPIDYDAPPLILNESAKELPK